MGVLLRQSIKNTLFTYLGFGIGAVNTLFLYTSFLTENQYGLVSYMLSVANVLSPFLTFGVQNTFIKFYSSYTEENDRNAFVSTMFFLPLIIILIGGLIACVSYDYIHFFISKENKIVGNYIVSMFLLSAMMAYFEVLFAWTKVHLRSVEGNFLKEVFPRLFAFFLLLFVFFEIIDFQQFIYFLLGSYFLRTLLMGWIAFRIKRPKWRFSLPKNTSNLLNYSIFLLLSSAVSSFFMDIDKVMLNQYVSLDKIAIYSVMVFMATIIAVPYRSVYQIINPLFAQYINGNRKEELAKIYSQSTDLLFVISGIIFLLLLLNAADFFALLPTKSYESGVCVLYLMAFIKLLDALTGMSNAVLFNTSYYRWILYLGLFLLCNTLILNVFFIPKWGINGAAWASFLSFFLYDFIKIYCVFYKEKLHPFSKNILKMILILGSIFLIFFFLKFTFSPMLNIIIRSLSVLFMYIFLIFHLKIITKKSFTLR